MSTPRKPGLLDRQPWIVLLAFPIFPIWIFGTIVILAMGLAMWLVGAMFGDRRMRDTGPMIVATSMLWPLDAYRDLCRQRSAARRRTTDQ
jgi:hypothetical protein